MIQITVLLQTLVFIRKCFSKAMIFLLKNITLIERKQKYILYITLENFHFPSALRNK